MPRAVMRGMQETLNACQQALEDEGRPVDLAALSPGEATAWDNRCGQLYVRSTGLVPTVEKSARAKINLMRHRIAVGVLREVSTVNSRGEPPTAECMDEDTDTLMADAYTLMVTLECLSLPWCSKIEVGNWSALGPMGGIAGGEWAVTLTYTAGHLRGE